MIISLDCETTGLDIYHGAQPYLVTSTLETGEVKFWEWNVDPRTRKVDIPTDDVIEIQQLIKSADSLVLQNCTFDYGILRHTNPEFVRYWDWDKVEDTLKAGHLLASNQRHNLTDMARDYLWVDIEPYEIELKRAVSKARLIGKKLGWRTAKKGLLDMPSAKGGSNKKDKQGINSDSPWKADTWLPRAVCLHCGKLRDQWERKTPKHNRRVALLKKSTTPWFIEYANPNHPWLTVASNYANPDSITTLSLWVGNGVYKGMKQDIQDRGYWNIYKDSMKLCRIANEMERRGVTVLVPNMESLETEYRQESARLGQVMLGIASLYNYGLELPRSAAPNDSLRNFFFGKGGMELKPLNLPKKKKKTSVPSLDKEVLSKLGETLDPETKEGMFVKTLLSKRKFDKDLTDIAGYRRFGIPQIETVPYASGRDSKGNPLQCGGNILKINSECLVLHPSVNTTGSDTLRFSITNPAVQTVKKEKTETLSTGEKISDKGKDRGRSVRSCFGPALGREWYKFDAKNIELRIPAFKAPEPELMEVFLYPDKPPYFGSYHLVIFGLLHPQLFRKHGEKCKKLFDATWYQWVKNGNFAVIYGSGEETADATYRVPGAFKKIKSRFPNLAKLSEETVQFAEKHGYVETFPDMVVDPHRGYPLMISRNEWEKVDPTKPFNYKIQGTAMQWSRRVMIETQKRLDYWWEEERFDAWICLQVHDEQDLDFPSGKSKDANLWRVKEMVDIMESCGKAIGVPTPVGVEHITTNWEEGEEIKL